ncbi:MAG: PAS domain S-box protein [Opitutales bacterium]
MKSITSWLLKPVGQFIVLGLSWVILTGLAYRFYFQGPWRDVLFFSAKELLFISLTAVLLNYFWLRRKMTAIDAENEIFRQKLVRNNLELKQANTLYAIVVLANEALIKIKDKKTLSQAICDALIEPGGMRLAWVGFIDGSTRRLVPYAAAGAGKEYLEKAVIVTDPAQPEGRGPTGRAVNEVSTQICQNIQTDPRMAPWLEASARHGLRSCAAVPLLLHGQAVGALTIYSPEPGSFSPANCEVLEQLAATLTRGLEMLELQEKEFHTEQELRNSADRFRRAVEQAPVPAFMHADDGEILAMSSTVTELSGYRRDELSDMNAWTRLAFGDDAPRVRQGIAALFGNEHRVDGGEFVIRCRDGSHRTWYFSSSGIGQLPDGRHLVFTVATDLTRQKQWIERLQLLDTAIQATPESVVITDANGRIEWVNAGFAKVTGYTDTEAVGQNPRLLKSGRQSREFYRQLWDTIKSGQIWRGELVNRRKDGKNYHEAMAIAPVRNDQGVITHFVAIKQDVTEQKSMEQQLLQAQRLEGIGLLASGIAHDLNNVLAPITLSVELLRKKYPEPTAQLYLDMIESAAKRGTHVVRQVLTFARGLGGERVPFKPKVLLNEIRDIIEETFPRTIRLTTEIVNDTPQVLGDPTQLHQVLLNLAINARDAMPQGGELSILVNGVEIPGPPAPAVYGQPAGRYVLFRVKDTGTGIPPEIVDRIFEPFFTTKEKSKGTGLGLSTVHGIVRNHGGFVEVQSEPGRGTEFRVYVPADTSATTPPMELKPEVILDGTGTGVLVVDDEEAIRLLLETMLLKRNFTVWIAKDGVEALEIFLRERPRISLVILDLMMPRMTGDMLAEAIHQISPGMPIIAMSGLVSQSSAMERVHSLRRAGTNAFFDKPFGPNELFAAIGDALPSTRPGAQGEVGVVKESESKP